MKNLKLFLAVPAIAMVSMGCASLFGTQLCPVSGEGLTSMGGPFVLDHKGQKVKLCCEGCKEDFDANPKKYLDIIAGKAPYPKPEE